MIGRTDEKPYNPIPWHGCPRDLTGDLQLGPYTRELTQRYVCGTRFATWDAKVFRYSRTLTASTTVASQGAFNRCGVVNMALTGTHAVVAGDRSHVVTLDADSGFGGGGIAENELIGGTITVGHAEGNEQTRTIMGNTVSAVSLPTTLLLDYPWDTTLTDTTAWTEITLNAYNHVSYASSNYAACVGVAVRDTTALQYAWLQTYGPCYMTGTGSTSNANFQRDAYVVGDGSVRDGSEITIEHGYQRIGYVLDESTSATAMPIVFLQISI